MSAHFDTRDIGISLPGDWSVTVCAWRGCCIEVFSRVEHSIADCLAAFDIAGLSLDRDARSPAPANRLRALANSLDTYSFLGHERKAKRLLSDWKSLHETRALLAHGRVVPRSDGIIIHHRTFDGKSEDLKDPVSMSAMEMLALLEELQRVQHSIYNQLGQIKAAATKAKAV